MVQLLRKKFTVTDFQQMAESGIIKDQDRFELIEGELIDMGKIGTKHAAYVDRLNDLLRDKFGKRVLVRSQNPVELNNYSQPQPDLAIVTRKADYYETRHPQPDEIFLLVEVADSTLELDREIKVPLYAQSKIIELWLVDLNQQAIAVYRQPHFNHYQEQAIFTPGQTISPVLFPDVIIEVSEIFS
jgi:Uma2 family endonuclease